MDDPTADYATLPTYKLAEAAKGTLTVVHQDTADTYSVVATVPTKRGARTIALDEATHRLYLPTASFGPPPSPSAERPHPRASILPGTFEVLVVER